MPVNSRAKGKASENAACRWLTGAGWPTKRRLSGNGQAGDLIIEAAPHVVVDVKDRAEPRIHDWLAQLDAEAAGRRCQALLWKPWSKGPDPALWLAIVADHPLDWMQNMVYGRVLRGYDGDLTTPALRAVLGWLEVEHTNDPGCPVLGWTGPDWSEWLLMRASTWADEVLPYWERAT